MKKLFLVALIASCTSAADEPSYIAGFTPPAPQTGYTRYVTPTIDHINPGDNVMYCQWVAAPQDSDVQVIGTLGYQSQGGHHVALYATSSIEDVGTSRPCNTRDMLTVTFVGAVGAEGIAAAKLPDGMAFTIPKGFALMTNTHYINASDQVLDGQSVIDVKYADPSDHYQSAGQVAVNNDMFSIPPGTDYSFDGYCTATTQSSFFMWGNHMHEWGSHTFSEIIHPDGSKTMLAEDDHWSSDLTFNPNWTRWDVATPLVVNAGDVFHVQCDWNNTTGNTLTFPDEMCVSTGFTLEQMPMSICEASPQM
jgi:hypothetical protein